MKKYCISACAKRKFSAVTEAVIEITVNTFIVIAVIIVLTLLVALLGSLIQFGALLAGFWLFNINPFEIVGLIVLAGATIWTILFYGYSFLSWIFSGVFYVAKNIALNIVAPDQADCRLFEECKS